MYGYLWAAIDDTLLSNEWCLDHVQCWIQTFEIRGGGGGRHPDSDLRASVWAKNKGGSPPPGPLPWIRHRWGLKHPFY